MAGLVLWLALAASPAINAAPSQPRYLFYLHGRIVEEQGPEGVSPVHGRYDYPAILDAFRARGFVVKSEVRPRDTDVGTYADRIAGEVGALLAKGVNPSRITIVGASKGAVIAALASTRIRNGRIRYVLLANCNTWLIRTHRPRLTGEVLSIYEQSDDVGGSCRALAARSPKLRRFEEVVLSTGLGHGVVYRPLESWVAPTAAWAARPD